MRKARILMIEDETDVLALNKAHFESQGYEVFCAKTLAEARASVYECPPDLILLDVLMPDGSGYDFCAEIRGLTAAPIIYLTCMGRDEDAVRGFALGGDDYVSKPYSLDVLSARIAASLRRSGLVNAGRIEKPPLVIDHLSGHVTLGGQEIQLSQKEKQLLSFMICNAGLEFSVAELFEAVWGAGEPGGTVRNHISNLRKKLSDANGNEYFEISLTYNKGYTFTQTKYN